MSANGGDQFDFDNLVHTGNKTARKRKGWIQGRRPGWGVIVMASVFLVLVGRGEWSAQGGFPVHTVIWLIVLALLLWARYRQQPLT